MRHLNSRTFGGTSWGFYDGAHPTADNSRRLLRYTVARSRSCFRPPKPSPSPSPWPSPSAPLVAAPADFPE
ncbi:MAG TPA: hypothetical protein VFH93_02145 [Thermoleophilia bacterium]|nr:hypothetical protein [Thermoleophilia bacterium]